jgi:hypothetical protein
VIGVLIGMVLLGLGIIKKSDDLKKASLGLFVVIAFVGFIVFFSGEP